MAEAKLTRAVLVAGALALMAVPCAAFAQQVGPLDLARATADPVDKLVGLWRVDRIEGASSHSLQGQVLRIDRRSVATLAHGTCGNPNFAEQLGAVAVSCIGQDLGIAAWDPQRPGTIEWSEGALRARLQRISGTEAGAK